MRLGTINFLFHSVCLLRLLFSFPFLFVVCIYEIVCCWWTQSLFYGITLLTRLSWRLVWLLNFRVCHFFMFLLLVMTTCIFFARLRRTIELYLLSSFGLCVMSWTLCWSTVMNGWSFSLDRRGAFAHGFFATGSWRSSRWTYRSWLPTSYFKPFFCWKATIIPK